MIKLDGARPMAYTEQGVEMLSVESRLLSVSADPKRSRSDLFLVGAERDHHCRDSF